MRIVVKAPSDAPPIQVVVDPGERLTEVELPDLQLDLDETTAEGVVERLGGYRVDFARDAKLVPRGSTSPERSAPTGT